MPNENLPVKANKKKQPVLQKRPNGFLYFLAARLYAPLMCKRKFNLVKSGERVPGPALVLSNHTSNHDYRGDLLPFGEGNVIKDVEIGDFVWIGADVLLLPGTKIGEGSIIQGGSVVHGEIPPCSIAGGNPAKVFAQRDREHFERLKAEGRYLSHTEGW